MASTRRRAYLAAKAVNQEPRGDVSLQQELLVCHVSPALFRGRGVYDSTANRKAPQPRRKSDQLRNGAKANALPGFGRYDTGLQGNDVIADVIEPIIMADQNDCLSPLFQIRQ